ncbi:MAG: hypothetical protein ACW981_05565 [Candidatus Hodarchaeales archaeon]|jgi:hypothetical protein
MTESDPEYQKLHRLAISALVLAVLISFFAIISFFGILFDGNDPLITISVLVSTVFLFSLIILLIVVLKKHKTIQVNYISTKFGDTATGEIKAFLFGKSSDPDKLAWKKFSFFSRKVLGDVLRIRIKVTHENVSDQLLNIYVNTDYNYDQEPPEIVSLLRCFTKSLEMAGLEGSFEKSSDEGELKGEITRYSEPYEFIIPFEKTKLHLTVILGEIQWNLVDSTKESETNISMLETLKENLLEQTKEYVKNGNRISNEI